MSEVQADRFNATSNWRRMAYLNQGRIWKGRNGVEMQIATMPPRYCRNAAKVLQRQHADLYRTVCAELLQMENPPNGGPLEGRERENYFQERTDMHGGSKAWIQKKYLMRALHRRGAQKEGEVGD